MIGKFIDAATAMKLIANYGREKQGVLIEIKSLNSSKQPTVGGRYTRMPA
jgi:hypothetical protein